MSYTVYTDNAIKSISNAANELDFMARNIAKNEFNHGVETTCEMFRSKVFQYAMDNNLKIDDVKPYIDVISDIQRTLSERI